MKIRREGIIFVISAPSGTGKTTICDRLISSFSDLKMSVSHTTRNPRPGEENGVDYFFVDKTTFIQMIRNDDFLEWAEVYGNYYGTSKKMINDLFISGNDILLDIDIQGAKNIKKIYKNSVLIFLIPPSMEELERRLIQRKEEASIIKKRINKAIDEIEQYLNYDYLVINDNLDEATEKIKCIIQAERQKINRINENILEKILNKGR